MVNYQVMLNSKAFSKDLLMLSVCSLNEWVLSISFRLVPVVLLEYISSSLVAGSAVYKFYLGF